MKERTTGEKVDQESSRHGSFRSALRCLFYKTHIWVIIIDNRVAISDNKLLKIEKERLVIIRSHTLFMIICAA
jgi:hypothetical protein